VRLLVQALGLPPLRLLHAGADRGGGAAEDCGGRLELLRSIIISISASAPALAIASAPQAAQHQH